MRGTSACVLCVLIGKGGIKYFLNLLCLGKLPLPKENGTRRAGILKSINSLIKMPVYDLGLIQSQQK